MTARQVYEGVLIEINKAGSPSILLEDFNYLFNKVVYQYINKRYNMFDQNQQLTDDLRVLKSTAIIRPKLANVDYGVDENNVALLGGFDLYGAVYEVELPTDYLHLLNCICNFKLTKNFKCYNKNSFVPFGAKRLPSGSWGAIINDFYLKPSYKNPYYYIHNVNIVPISEEKPTSSYTNHNVPNNVVDGTLKINTDSNQAVTSIELTQGTTIPVGTTNNKDHNISLVEKQGIFRYGNVSPVRMEIRYGKDNSIFELVAVSVDYLKTPQHIRLTQEQIDLTEDSSQLMEFPDYVCQEIINELAVAMLENSSDPRLQTHIPINQSIASPNQQQTQTKK